jgi:hypothetical protein
MPVGMRARGPPGKPRTPLRSVREKESAIALPMPLATLVTTASVFLKFIVRFFRSFA